MKHLSLPLALLLSVPAAFSQKKEVQEMQRDMLLMQDQLRALQRSQDEKLAAMQVLLQQTLDTANKANTAVAVLESSIRERFKEQERTIVAPVAGVGSKVDSMSTDFASVREAVADLSSRMGKMQGQITDLAGVVKAMATPAAPPPMAGGAPQGVSAEALWSGAMRDKSTGNSDAAIQQFEDYLRWFDSTDQAPDAQYYIGEIKYLRGDYDGALQAFDALLEKYPDNKRTPEAILYKGRGLVKAGFKAEARQEFNSVIKRFPNTDAAAKARTELAALNSVKPSPASRTTKKR